MSYNTDLAYIYEAGFSGFALSAAPGLLRLLRRNGIEDGLVVDLACGNGIWPRQLGFAGYEVVAVDGSEAMVRLARKTAPAALCIQQSLTEFQIPSCRAVTAIGQGISHSFSGSFPDAFPRFCSQVHEALPASGVFIFDFARSGRLPGGMPPSANWSGADWSLSIEGKEHTEKAAVVRSIQTSRQVDGCWRHNKEVHTLRLFEPDEIMSTLRQSGFQVRQLRGYGDVRFRSGSAGVIAVKA